MKLYYKQNGQYEPEVLEIKKPLTIEYIDRDNRVLEFLKENLIEKIVLPSNDLGVHMAEVIVVLCYKHNITLPVFKVLDGNSTQYEKIYDIFVNYLRRAAYCV